MSSGIQSVDFLATRLQLEPNQREKIMTREFKTYSNPNFELPTLVRQIKENCFASLANHSSELFDRCDDVFFDLSSHANNNNEQNLYFESMREIRLKKLSVLNGFQQNLESSYQELARLGPPTETPEDKDQPLALIDNDQLEQRVAIKAMTSKARSKQQENLYHLCCRLDFLIKQKSIGEANNPFDPEKIITAFDSACSQLDLNIKAKIILYKQFEQQVFSQLGPIYSQLNQQLINAGILPKIQGKINKQDETASQDKKASPQLIESSEDFAGLQQLLTQLRQNGDQSTSIIALIPGYNANAPTMPRYDLISSIGQIQTNQSAPQGDEFQQIDIRQAIQSILASQYVKGEQRSVSASDEDVINLVSLFFDYVLDDQNIPVSIQALIARLQLPVLRQALADNDFLQDSQHPARNLINKIAEASQGWNDSELKQQRQLHNEVHKVVHNVLELEHEKPAVFSEQLELFSSFLKSYERKSNLVEKRASEAAVGKAKTEAARLKLKSFIDERTQNRHLPKVVAHFLDNYWQQVMLFTLLRDSEDSQAWLECTQVVDDLLWSCQQHRDEKSQHRLGLIKATLFSSLENGLNKVFHDHNETQQQLELLQQLHSKLQANDYQDPLVAEEVDTEATSEEQPKYSAIERQKQSNEKIRYEFIQKAESTPLNTWLSFEESNGELIRRRLMARVEESDTYIFVNRFGAKPIEMERKEFARRLQNNKAWELDKRPLFDRAISNLRKQLEGKKAKSWTR